MMIMRIRKWHVIALCLMLCGSLVLTNSVWAEDTPESITLSPTSRKYQVTPGQVVNDTMTVINDGKTTYDLLIYARPYSVTNESYVPNFAATLTNADAYKWVTFPTTSYHMVPGASQTINFSMHVPTQANAGGHYGVIFAETQPSGPTEGTSVIRKKRVGMIIYATVSGNYKTGGQAAGSEIPFWQLQPPLHTTMSATNTGNTDFDDETQIVVKDVFGNPKYTGSKEYIVLPQTTRKMSLDWDNAFWFGLYRVEIQQKVLGQTTSASGYVLMMPRYLPIALVIALIAGGAYAWFRRRS